MYRVSFSLLPIPDCGVNVSKTCLLRSFSTGGAGEVATRLVMFEAFFLSLFLEGFADRGAVRVELCSVMYFPTLVETVLGAGVVEGWVSGVEAKIGA